MQKYLSIKEKIGQQLGAEGIDREEASPPTSLGLSSLSLALQDAQLRGMVSAADESSPASLAFLAS